MQNLALMAVQKNQLIKGQQFYKTLKPVKIIKLPSQNDCNLLAQ